MVRKITSGEVNGYRSRPAFAGAACVAAAVAALFPCALVQAATYTYNRNITNTLITPDQWSTGLNWSGGTAPVSALDTTLVFNGTLPSSATIFSNNDIVGNFQLNALTFNAVGPAATPIATETISGNALQFVNSGATAPVLTLNTTGSQKPALVINNNIQLDDTLTLAATTNGTILGVISSIGTMGLTKTQTGTLTLSGANTYTGATTVSAGTLTAGVASVAGVSGAFGNNSAVTIGNVSGATLNLNNFATRIGSLAGGGAAGGSVNLGSAELTVGGDNTSTAFAGVISNTGKLTKVGTGTLALSGINTFSGNTAVSGGALNLQNSYALQNSVLTTGGLIFDSSVVSKSFSVGSLNGGSGLLLQNNAGSPEGIALTIGNNTTAQTYSGAMSGAGSVNKVGTGTQTFSGTNSYSGGTTINGGVLQYNNAAAIPAAGKVKVNGPAAVGLNFAGVQAVLGTKIDNTSTGAIALTTTNQNENIDFSSGGANMTGAYLGAVGTITYGGIYTPNGGVYRLGGGGGTLNYGAAITGSSSLSIGGGPGGTVNLTAANSFTGATTYSSATAINAGGNTPVTLTLGGTAGALTATSSIQITGGGVLSIDDSGTNLADRVVDSAAVSLGAGTIELKGKASTAATETLGAITIGAGQNVLKLTPGTSATASLTFASLSHADGGSFIVTRDAASVGSKVMFQVAPALVGGIIPFGVHATSGTVGLTNLATYDATEGVIAAAYQRTSLNAAGATTDNVRLAAAETMAASQTVNALVHGPGTLNLGGKILTLNSGHVLLAVDQGSIDGGTIDFGSASGFVYGQSRNNLGTNSAVILTGIGGVTYTGALTLNAVNANYTGPTYISGSVSPGNFAGYNKIPDLSALILNPGGSFATTDGRLASYNEVIGSLAGSGRILFNVNNAANVGIIAGGDNTSTTFSGAMDGTFNFTKVGTGIFTYTGLGNNVGVTKVSGGTMLINGDLHNSAFTAAAGGILGGSGSVGNVNVTGGILSPGNSPGILSTGSVSFDNTGTYLVDITGSNAVAGTDYDQTNVTGTVNLGGSVLQVALSGFTPSVDQLFFVLRNDGSDAVTGTFAGLPDGTAFLAGGQQFQISYFGNAEAATPSFLGGNDVVLQAVPEPASAMMLGVVGLTLLRRRRR